MNPLHEQRDRTIDALVAEQYQAALDAGHVIHNPSAFKASKREDIIRQAKAHPGWLRQQSDRMYGAQTRPGTTHVCPNCSITFNPDDTDRAAPYEYHGPDHPVWTDGTMHVAVPPQHAAIYKARGWRPLDEQPDNRPQRNDDHPTRGADGQLYCRANCAARDDDCGLDDWLATTRTPAEGYMRTYLAQRPDADRAGRDDTPTLALPAPVDEPITVDVEDVLFDDEPPAWSAA